MPGDIEILGWIFSKIAQGIVWVFSLFVYGSRKIETPQDDELNV